MDDGNGEPGLSPDRESELSRRLRDLDHRLAERRPVKEASPPAEPQAQKPGYAMAMRLGADFVAGVVVGAALGWGIDRFFGTAPWGLIIFLMLGFAAGVLTVMRSAGLVKPGPAGPDDLPRSKG
jgi:ATP synthase protein I